MCDADGAHPHRPGYTSCVLRRQSGRRWRGVREQEKKHREEKNDPNNNHYDLCVFVCGPLVVEMPLLWERMAD